jgi:hypothetical protein
VQLKLKKQSENMNVIDSYNRSVDLNLEKEFGSNRDTFRVLPSQFASI